MDRQHPLGDHGLHNAQQAGALLDFMEVVVGVPGPKALVFGKLAIKIPVQPDALLTGAVECLKNLSAVDVPHGVENAEAHGNGIVFQIDPEPDIGHAVGGLHKFIYGGAVVQQIRGRAVFLIKKVQDALVLQHGLAHILRQLRLLGDGVHYLGGKIFVLRHVVFQL